MTPHGLLHSERRSGRDSVSSHFEGGRESFDPIEKVKVIKIISGEWHVTGEPDVMLATILGSCVSACIRDPIAGVGGMNHFLLPGDGVGSQAGDSARYGMFAMESLINAIMRLGGQKHRFEVKVFGGGNVINNSARIGSRNAEFVREFLRRENFRILSEDMEGDYPRRLNYYPGTGKVMMRQLRRREDLSVVQEEQRYKESLKAYPIESNIELF